MPARAPVAVAVVSWNTRQLLDRCLASLRTDHEAGRAEVWVVDNASDDGSPDLVRDRHGWAQLVEPGENVGFGAAVNLVAARTRAPWVAAANADVEVTPGALEALLAAGEREPRAGAVAPRLVLPDGSTQHSVHPFPTLPVLLAFNLGVHRVVPGLGDRLLLEGRWQPERGREVDWALAAFLLVRRRAFEDVGGFAEEQWLYAEDLDLGWRLARAGWTTRYEPRAVVRHRSGAAAERAFGDDALARQTAASYAWLLRRRGLARTRASAAVNLVGAAARAAGLAPLARLAPGRFAEARAGARRWARLHREVGLGPREALERHR